MEYVGLGALGIGLLIALIGWVWLIITGFKEGGPLWGVMIILFSWLAGLIFCVVKKTGWAPLIMMIVGGILASLGMFATTMLTNGVPPVTG